RRALARARRARAAPAHRPLRDRGGGAGVHLERAAPVSRGRPGAPRDTRRRRAVVDRARRAAASPRPRPGLLEEREVAAWNRALGERPARLLGALRLPQRRRPLAGGALQLLITRPRDGDARRPRRCSPRTNPHPLA